MVTCSYSGYCTAPAICRGKSKVPFPELLFRRRERKKITAGIWNRSILVITKIIPSQKIGLRLQHLRLWIESRLGYPVRSATSEQALSKLL